MPNPCLGINSNFLHLYTYSGSNGNAMVWRMLDTTEYYDEATSSWRLGPPLPTPARSLSAGIPISDTEVLLFGAMTDPTGFIENNVGPQMDNKVLLFDVPD